MQSNTGKGYLREAEDAGQSQRNHEQLDPRLKLITALSQTPAVRERTHDGVVDGIPQACHEEQRCHPCRIDAQNVGAEGKEVGVHEQVDKAAGHIAADISHLIQHAERPCLFFHGVFSFKQFQWFQRSNAELCTLDTFLTRPMISYKICKMNCKTGM